MSSKPPPRDDPPEGFSIARQVMADVVEHFLKNGGPAVARIELNKLAEVVLKVYDDGWEAYQALLEKINQVEEAERQKKAHDDQKFGVLMEKMMNCLSSTQLPTPPATHAAKEKAAVTETGMTDLPEKLRSPKAMKIWKRLQEAGIVDEHYQPIRLSRTMKACLATRLSCDCRTKRKNYWA